MRIVEIQHSHQKHIKHTGHTNYTGHTGHMIKDLKQRFFISLILTIPILILSPFIQNLFKISFNFQGDKIILFILSTIIFIYGGSIFLKGALSELKNHTLGMMVLISLAISVAYFYSLAVMLGFKGEAFFWELATLIDVMLLGHWIEMRSTASASNALQKLAGLIPEKAHLKKGNEYQDVHTHELKPKDIILVKPGESIPIDGIILKGSSFINESMLTGESAPVSKFKGQKVIGGSINQEGSLEIQIENVNKGTYLFKVMNLVKQAQLSKSKTQVLADKAAFWLTIIAICAGILTLLSWLIIKNDASLAIARTATVLVITCPHALGLAIPLVNVISTTLSAQNGLLIKNRAAFENARKITTIIFDKTGTLTEGTFKIETVRSFSKKFTKADILKLTASIEQNSEHSIARAVVKDAKSKGIKLKKINNFKLLKGRGVEALINGKRILAISSAYTKELIKKDFSKNLGTETKRGTVINLIIKDKNKFNLIGSIVLKCQ